MPLVQHRRVLQLLVFTSRIRVREIPIDFPIFHQIFFPLETFSSVNKDAVAARFGTKPGQLPFGGGYDDHYTFQQQTAEVLKRFTVHVAKQTHRAFQKFFLFIHGINSGYALWVCVFAFVFTNGNTLGFFNIYRTIALITHLLFYLFLALCMVDVLDR